jgi:hypothetical protein
MLSIQITPSPGFGEKIYGLSARIRTKWNQKLEQTAELLHEKVLENLSGKILGVRSGQLRDSIQKDVYSSGYDFIAFVGPVPATPKAFALEYGGKGDYLIPVGPKGFLANREGDFFTKHSVDHPPSKEYAYLRMALEEVEIGLPGELVLAVDEAL